MDKLWLIIKREYLTRVKSKSFLLSTFLTPVAFLVFFIVVGFIMGNRSDVDKKVVILDPGNVLNKVMKDERSIYYSFSDKELNVLKKDVEAGTYDGVLMIPKPDSAAVKNLKVFYYAENQLGLDAQSDLENQIADKVSEYKIQALGLDKEVLDNIKTKVTIDPEPISVDQKDESSSAAAIGADSA